MTADDIYDGIEELGQIPSETAITELVTRFRQDRLRTVECYQGSVMLKNTSYSDWIDRSSSFSLSEAQSATVVLLLFPVFTQSSTVANITCQYYDGADTTATTTTWAGSKIHYTGTTPLPFVWTATADNMSLNCKFRVKTATATTSAPVRIRYFIMINYFWTGRNS